MILTIPKVFPRPQIAALRARLDAAEWVDGRVTAGHQSAQTKQNSQIPETHPVAVQVGELILAALGSNPLFRSAALPLRVFPPLFNRYTGGQTFGTHVDNSLRTHGSHRRPHPHRPLLHPLLLRPRRVRRRRARHRGHLRQQNPSSSPPAT